MNKKWFCVLAGILAIAMMSGVAFADTPSTLDTVQKAKKIVIGSAPGYLPFEMMDKQGNFIGYDIDLGRAIAKSLGVEVEFRQFEFSGLIPALQTGDIDMFIAGMTIRGDRALAVSFSNPYYATGRCSWSQVAIRQPSPGKTWTSQVRGSPFPRVPPVPC